MWSAILFGIKGAVRRRASFWPLWAAFSAAVILLIFMNVSGIVLASDQTHSLSSVLGESDVNFIYRAFLIAGFLVCLLQSQLLTLRALREERRQLLQLVTVGISPWWILLAKSFEYAFHTVAGAMFGGLFGSLIAFVFLRSVITPQAIVWGTLITLASLPTTVCFVLKFLSSSQRQRDIIM